MAIQEKVGIVVSDKMDKTKIVAVNDRVTHRRYGKVITKTKRYAVHDSKLNTSVGDKVKIREIAPLSKTKNWLLISVLGK